MGEQMGKTSSSLYRICWVLKALVHKVCLLSIRPVVHSEVWDRRSAFGQSGTFQVHHLFFLAATDNFLCFGLID